MYFVNMNFSLIKQVGSISSVKVDELRKEFSALYPENFLQSNNDLVFRKGPSLFVISERQIAYISQGSKDEVDINSISEQLTKANEILGLSNETNLMIRLELINNVNKNTLTTSLEYSKELSDIIDARGIGYRFMIHQEYFQGDIKVEPYIKDPNNVFVDVSLETTKIVDINNLTDCLTKIFNYSLDNSQSVYTKIF